MGRGRKPKGLGDVIENITEATGIKAVVKAIAGDDCGCEQRKQWLNQKFRFKSNCLSEEDVQRWKDFDVHNKRVLTMEDQSFIVDLLKKGYNISVEPCSSCGASNYKNWINMIDELTK